LIIYGVLGFVFLISGLSLVRTIKDESWQVKSLEQKLITIKIPGFFRRSVVHIWSLVNPLSPSNRRSMSTDNSSPASPVICRFESKLCFNNSKVFIVYSRIFSNLAAAIPNSYLHRIHRTDLIWPLTIRTRWLHLP
jgi:hypothetical protein